MLQRLEGRDGGADFARLALLDQVDQVALLGVGMVVVGIVASHGINKRITIILRSPC